jgi:hypothetical protein
MNKNEKDNNIIESGKRKRKNDIIFISVLLSAVILMGACFFFIRPEGELVKVTVDKELFGEYPLSEDITVEIRSGSGLNVLVIKDGKAYVSEASCPDGICSAHKPISREGESIICLPNKVVVTVVSSDTEGPDIIV